MKTQTQKPKRLLLPLCVTACVLLVVFFFAVNTGGIHVSPAALLCGLFIAYDRDVAIILQLRFPRIFMAMVGGAMMSVAGVLMQAVMRNPLADPGIIGVSSGAAFAAVLVSSFLPSLALWTPLFSFAGGLLAFFLVYLLAQKGTTSPIRLILTGITIPGFDNWTIPTNETLVNCDFYNPDGNSCYFEISIRLSETGTEIYHSRLLRPGQHLYDIELLSPVPAGSYDAVIHYSTYAIEDNSPMNGADVPFRLIAE